MWLSDFKYNNPKRKLYSLINSWKSLNYSGAVYNLEVDEDHSYSTTSFVIHNCTSEEDVDLGLRLARVGCRFWFKSNPDVNAYHMTHGLPELNPSLRYKPEECHRVTRGMYNELEGSHALIKRNSQRPLWKVNEGVFDLKAARLEA
jgi:hypothetical protein